MVWAVWAYIVMDILVGDGREGQRPCPPPLLVADGVICCMAEWVSVTPSSVRCQLGVINGG